MNYKPEEFINPFARYNQVSALRARTRFRVVLALAGVVAGFSAAPSGEASGAPARSEPIPMGQPGAIASKEYQGDGLSVAATTEGARLRCVFQRLEGLATGRGLWLASTVTNDSSDRFGVIATALGHEAIRPTKQTSNESDERCEGMVRHAEATAARVVALTGSGWVRQP
jgi:hypothetical protein